MKNKRQFVLFLSLACLVPAALLFSQSGAGSKSAEFDHTTVHVRDLQKSADFYEKVFGLERIPHPFKDANHVWFRIGAHQQLHVVGGAAEASASRDIEVHFAFRVPTISDFTARLDQMQVKYRSIDGSAKVTNRPDGVHQIYLQDPDGYWIEVNDDKF
jgi:lactoylglutathione lyase